MSEAESPLAQARAALRELAPDLAALGLHAGDHGESFSVSVGRRRALRRAGEPDPVASASLIGAEDGLLLWHDEPFAPALAGRRLRRGLPPPPEGEVVELYQFEKLEPNRVTRFLRDFDARLNPVQGLRAISPGAGPQPLGSPPTGRKRRLLFVHGTFSRSETLLDGIAAAPNAAAFWKRVHAHYDEVLAFDHPTLAVSPVLNAFDLGRLLARAEGPLDVVAHSRGGLVARWFLEGFGGHAGGTTRAVLVGSPLNGTSLASPPRLRSSASLLTNLGTALKIAGQAATIYAPLLLAPLALLRVAASFVGTALKTPLVDAAVALVPGLAAQSRVGGNAELERLRALSIARPPKYFAVRSNFESERAGLKFWRYFRKGKWADLGADVIFPGDNDLVVDTDSMTDFSARPFAGAQLDYGTSATVHHTNYFEQQRTLDFILASFEIG